MKRKWILLGICFGALILLCWAIISQTMLLRCQTDSLSNVNYLLVKKGASFERGDIVCLQDHRSQYLENNKFLAKRAVGLPGDQIQKVGSVLKVIPQRKDAMPLVFHLLKQTSKGKPLTSLSPQTISEGYVFVAGDHPKSFDSRYEEFGLVKIENIQGRALWWW